MKRVKVRRVYPKEYAEKAKEIVTEITLGSNNDYKLVSIKDNKDGSVEVVLDVPSSVLEMDVFSEEIIG